MITLLVKVTLLFLAGIIALLTTRRATAGMRHVLCICTLAGSLECTQLSWISSRVSAVRLSR